MADLDWTPAGPRSRRFEDVYFSAEDGLAEARAVFLRGCGLPERWRGRASFTVAELGFGTGLNVLALLELWARERPAGATLHVFSVEAFPMRRAEAARALATWPELASLARPLLEGWPRGAGWTRISWPEIGATLDLAIDEALAAMLAWDDHADAWFLDGFAPSRNPDMWRPELLEAVRRCSAPGAVAATFTVAGSVRRGLEAAGFTVAKRPGFGRKRERLEAVLDGGPPGAPSSGRVAIVGAGVAGAALARAFAALGQQVTVVAPPSGEQNLAALVSPRFDAGAGAAARMTLQAFRRAFTLYTADPEVVIARGLLQLEAQPRDGRRFDALASGSLFAPGEVERVSAAEASAWLGEPIGRGGLHVPTALTVDPARVLATWLAHAERRAAEVAKIEPHGAGGWRLLDASGALIIEAETVVLASGWGLVTHAPTLPLQAVRGQASWSAAAAPPPLAVAWGGYAVATREGVLFGATHDRDRMDVETNAADHARNLQAVGGALPVRAATLDGGALEGRAAIRSTTPDRLPLAGRLAPGLFVLGGLGSRGFTFAPLLAEHVAALALETPSPLSADFAVLVDPLRFG